VTYSLTLTKIDKARKTMYRHRTANTRGLNREKLMRETGDTNRAIMTKQG